MIKVEVIEEEGKRFIFFETNNSQEDTETLDQLLEAIVGPFPRRGAYVNGNLLKVEVNTSSS